MPGGLARAAGCAWPSHLKRSAFGGVRRYATKVERMGLDNVGDARRLRISDRGASCDPWLTEGGKKGRKTAKRSKFGAKRMQARFLLFDCCNLVPCVVPHPLGLLVFLLHIASYLFLEPLP